MKSLSDTILKRLFLGTNYYATGGTIPGTDGKRDVFYTPVMDLPTERLIERHLAGEVVVGAYTTRQDNTVTWMVFDVDSIDRNQARDLTAKIDTLLADIPHGIEFSGNKGYHIWIFFKKPVPAENVRNIGSEIRDLVGAKVSGDTHVEIFPKQDKLTPSNPLGNLVKVPLGTHPLTGVKSKFISTINWENGEELDPLTILESTTTLEDFGNCISSYEDPSQTIVDILAPHWTEGSRHDLALYLSGWLATAGWSEEDAMDLVERLNNVSGGDLNNQLRCVTDTYKKHREGGQILGLQALSERLPGTSLRKLADAIARQNITPIMMLIDKIRLAKGVTYLKSRSAANAIVSYLAEKGKVLVDQNTEKLFWLDKTSHHVYSMEDSWWDTVLYNTFGLNTSESFGNSTAKGIYHTSREQASKIRTHSRSYWDGEKLWINLGGSYNYVIDGAGNYSEEDRFGRKILNGEEGVIFRTRDTSLKIDLDYSLSKGIEPLNPWKFLVDDLNFGIGSSGVSPQQQRELIKAWFLSTFFPNIMPTRPLLTIIADPGAGKTTAARRFLYVLEGPHADVNGVVTDKPDSLRASLAAHKFLVLDNLEKNKSYWLVDLLNRVSTGTHIELRKLHTTNEIQRILPDCFILLTATSLPFAEESLFTRLLPVELATLKNPTPEYSMQHRILDNLDGIWMGILSMMDPVVAELRRITTAPAPTENRLADFTVFCNRIRGLTNGEEGILNGEALIQGLEMMTNRQKILLHEASPMIAVLDIWIREDRAAGERQGKGSKGLEAPIWHTAAELNGILQGIAMRAHSQWIWDTGQSLGKHIQALEPHLIRNYGMETILATNNSPKKYRFNPPIIDSDGTTPKQDDKLKINLKRNE